MHGRSVGLECGCRRTTRDAADKFRDGRLTRPLQLVSVLGGRLNDQRTMAPASPDAEATEVIAGNGSARYHRGVPFGGSTS